MMKMTKTVIFCRLDVSRCTWDRIFDACKGITIDSIFSINHLLYNKIPPEIKIIFSLLAILTKQVGVG